MRVRGDINAITGFTCTSLLNLEACGVKAEDVVVLLDFLVGSSRLAYMPRHTRY